MNTIEQYRAPFSTDDELRDPDWIAAKTAWDGDQGEPLGYVHRWHELISRTNWEKGKIISQWRQALIDQGESNQAYADEAWAEKVGGVTAAHVGRLRRVYQKYAGAYESYPHLSWTHFLVAMDWDDAPLWLQGASDGRWSVSLMRRQRWEATGKNPAESPDKSIVTGDVDEDYLEPARTADPSYVQPAQGGGSERRFEDKPDNISAGPVAEQPDFGDEAPFYPTAAEADPRGDEVQEPAQSRLVQPFAGLPELPDDLNEAIELLKLSVVRHKATGWCDVDADTVRNYLSAFFLLIDARSQ